MNRPATASWPHHRFTIDDYHQMAATGILSPDDRVELLDGEVVQRLPIGPTHAAVVGRLNRWLARSLGDRGDWRVQQPVVLSQYSEPEPDLAVVQMRDDDYESGHPVPADVLFLIEVADSTLAPDRRFKVPLYAQAGVPEVWLVNLVDKQIEVYREPRDGRYRQRTDFRGEQKVSPQAFSDLRLRVRDVVT